MNLMKTECFLVSNCSELIFQWYIFPFFQCFFPENVISGIRTPLFILNTAYDSWQVNVWFQTPSSKLRQICYVINGCCDAHYLTILLTNIFSFCRQIQSSLAPPADDPRGYWHDCRLNHAKCTGSQMQFLQGGLIHKKMLLLEVHKLVSECITIKPFNHII